MSGTFLITFDDIAHFEGEERTKKIFFSKDKIFRRLPRVRDSCPGERSFLVKLYNGGNLPLFKGTGVGWIFFQMMLPPHNYKVLFLEILSMSKKLRIMISDEKKHKI